MKLAERRKCRTCDKFLIQLDLDARQGNICIKCSREYALKYNRKRAKEKKKYKRF